MAEKNTKPKCESCGKEIKELYEVIKNMRLQLVCIECRPPIHRAKGTELKTKYGYSLE